MKVLNIIGIIGILDSIFAVTIKAGLNIGSLLPGVVGIMILIWAKYRDFLQSGVLKERYRWFRKIFIAVGGLWLISFFIIEGFILSWAVSTSREKVDYVIILGAGLNGKDISLTLKERLDKGINYVRENPNAMIVVTGGQGLGEETTEALAMKDYLTKNNIDQKQIIIEDKATSTMENFKFTKEKLRNIDKKDQYKIMIITSEFHMFRSKILAGRNGFMSYGISSQTPFYILPNCLIREYFAVVKSLLFDK